MKKLLAIFIVCLAAVLFLALPVFKNERDLLFSKFNTTQSLLASATHDGLFPTPLRGNVEEANAHLDHAAVITITNAQRAKFGKSSLAENQKLDKAAQQKLQDMFDKQYFEHVSPSGVGPGDLADRAGYSYVIVGENLALGNFKDSAALVDAWMNSPGHRANILNTRYSEIGVAVGQGSYQGHTTWLAVQEFGRPLASCPQPSTALKQELDDDKALTARLEQQLAQRKQEVDSAKASGDQDRYAAAVRAYNDVVNELNNSIDRAKQAVARYNAEVNSFNACLKE